MIFYFVRHGQTDWNLEKRMQGHMNIPLNATGIKQINDLADKIVENKICFDRMIASPLDRAKVSAEIIAEKTGFEGGIIFDEDFMERSCGLLEGVVWTPELDLDDPRYKVEPVPDLCKRARKALDKYVFEKDEKVMIVAHGAILAATKTVLSEYRIDYFDRSVPIIQGNVMCCEIEEGKEPRFYNVFDA